MSALTDIVLAGKAEIRFPSVEWLAGDGEMARLVRSLDWAHTPLGPLSSWPQSLRSALSICLGSRFPIVIYWGPDLVVLYNDAYAEILGKKHPSALGRPCREVWSEIWDVIGPMLHRVLTHGDATWSEDRLLLLERRGYPEECYFSFSFSPVRGANGNVDGIFTAVVENTGRVLSERRLRTLRDLGASLAEAKSAERACSAAAGVLAENQADVPFALFYLIDPQTSRGTLVSSVGDDDEIAAAPASFELDLSEGVAGWPLARVCRSGEPALVAALSSSALILPLTTAGDPDCSGIIVAGVSSRRELDQDYRGFFELVARRVAAGVAEARAYDAERRRAEALAEIDRAKTTFFSNISHEFRTPLTLMLGPLEELKAEISRSDRTLRPAQYQQIDLAHRNGLRLLRLVNTLLDFSRIEAGRVRAVYEPTDLSSVTAELASMFRSAIEKAGLRLVVDCPMLSDPAYVDREMWEKIVLNLMSNAFKFTFVGEIDVRVREVDDHFELTVRDSGTGIPAHELPKLFERFHRVIGTHGRTHEGSGIGLALVQELVKLHGGSVAVESEYGKGSTFRVVIPRGRDHLSAEQIATVHSIKSTSLGARHFVDEALRWLPDAGLADERLTDGAATSQKPESDAGHRAHVLLADDNADMREYVRRLLVARYEVEAVADGEAALASVQRNRPDLVLTDVMMPRLDGMQLLARLRADPQTSTIPVILLSARAGEENRIEGMQVGADDYLTKPFSARELLARVEAHLKIARYRSEATEILRASEERYRAFVAASSDIVFRMSPDWKEMRNLEGKDFVTDTTEPSEGWLATYIHPDDRAHVMEAVSEAIGTMSAFELEHRVIRIDGTPGWAHSRAIPVLGAGGEIVEWFGAARDITDRKQAEQTQTLLINELNHRVKNTLASVQAIAQQTLRRTRDPEEFVRSFAGRIQSLARVHSLLSATTWRSADLNELVRDQLLHGSFDETRVTAAGPPVQMEPQMALHMAMMLHELCTNAVKYGALSTSSGRVTVSWHVADGTLRFGWKERGGPLARVPAKRGFGSTLIEQSAKGEGGTARMVVEADGISWDIALPLAQRLPATESKQRTIALVANAAWQGAPAAQRDSGTLAGKRFLIVEDEPLVAMDLADGLSGAGAEVVASVASSTEALQVIEKKQLDAALLDGNLNGYRVDEIASTLKRHAIPFVFISGYGRESLPVGFREVALLNKPFSRVQLLEVVKRLIAHRADDIPLQD